MIEILSTRELEDTLLEQAAEKSVAITCEPFICIENHITPNVQAYIDQLATQEALVVFTSRNGVAAVTHALQGKKPNWQIACLGGATRQQATNYFGKEAIVVAAPLAQTLGQQMEALQPQLPVVFFAGDRRLDTIPAALTNAGIVFEEKTVYRTIDTPVALNRSFDGILFLSPSAADSYFALNQAAPHTVFFVIGTTTEAHLKTISNNPVIVSKRHAPQAILDEVYQHFNIN